MTNEKLSAREKEIFVIQSNHIAGTVNLILNPQDRYQYKITPRMARVILNNIPMIEKFVNTYIDLDKNGIDRD